MKFIRRNWYSIGLCIGIMALISLPFLWKHFSVVQRLLYMNFIAMTIHQFEEFGFPGGMPILLNAELMKSDRPERYPQNANAVMVGNMLTVYVFYLLPVFFPNQIWFGLGGVLVGLTQTPVHFGVAKMLKSIYAPGNLALVFGHIPIGIYFIYYGVTNHLIGGMDWVLAVLVMLFVSGFLVVALGYKVLADKNSPYPFSEKEMNRPWMLKKIARSKRLGGLKGDFKLPINL